MLSCATIILILLPPQRFQLEFVFQFEFDVFGRAQRLWRGREAIIPKADGITAIYKQIESWVFHSRRSDIPDFRIQKQKEWIVCKNRGFAVLDNK